MSAEKRYLTADAYLRDIWRLAAKIRRGGWRPDVIVGLWRGGAPAAIAVHEFLKVTGWDVGHVPLKCASYTGIGCNEGRVEFTFGDEVFGRFREGERVLFVDDVFDTGKTAAAVRERMRGVGADARLACVYWKPEMNRTTLSPDYFAEDVGGDWLVFPHEMSGLTAAELEEKDAGLAAIVASTGHWRG